MLYEAMKKEIESQFPNLQFSADDEKKLISISPIHENVGSLEIQDDYDELTRIFVRTTSQSASTLKLTVRISSPRPQRAHRSSQSFSSSPSFSRQSMTQSNSRLKVLYKKVYC